MHALDAARTHLHPLSEWALELGAAADVASYQSQSPHENWSVS